VLLRPPGRGGKKALQGRPRALRIEDRTPRPTVDQRTPVGAPSDTEAGVAIVVGRAAGLPLIRAGLPHGLQAFQDALYRVSDYNSLASGAGCAYGHHRSAP